MAISRMLLSFGFIIPLFSASFSYAASSCAEIVDSDDRLRCYDEQGTIGAASNGASSALDPESAYLELLSLGNVIDSVRVKNFNEGVFNRHIFFENCVLTVISEFYVPEFVSSPMAEVRDSAYTYEMGSVSLDGLKGWKVERGSSVWLSFETNRAFNVSKGFFRSPVSRPLSELLHNWSGNGGFRQYSLTQQRQGAFEISDEVVDSDLVGKQLEVLVGACTN